MPNRIVEALAGEFSEWKQLTTENLARASENASANRQGSIEPTVFLPRGTTFYQRSLDAVAPEAQALFKRLLKNSEIAKLPFYSFVPLGYPDGSSWLAPDIKDPKQARFEKKDNGNQLNGRPLVILRVEPTIPGKDVFSHLWISSAEWKPGKQRRIKEINTALAVDLCNLHQVTAVDYMSKSEPVPVWSNQMTADTLVQGLMNWLGDKTGDDALTDRFQLAQALEQIKDLNPLWQIYWNRVQSRQTLGFILNTLDTDGHGLTAALETLLQAPQGHQQEAKSMIAQISSAVRQGQTRDWSSFCQVVKDQLGEKDIPMTLTVGLNPLMELLNRVAGAGIVNDDETRKALARSFQLAGDEKPPLNMVINGSAVRFLLLDPGILASMLSSIYLDWVPEMVGQTQDAGKAVTAGLQASRVAIRAYREGWESLTRALQGQQSAINRKSAASGRKIGETIAGNLPEHVIDLIRRQIPEALLRTANGNKDVIDIQPIEN